jgi:hypothetical protein
MKTFTIKRNDRLPSLIATLADESGPYNLTGATVDIIWKPSGGVATRAACTIVTAASGIVRYDWSATDTLTAGTYDLEFEATISGKKMTFPNAGYLQLIIEADLT